MKRLTRKIVHEELLSFDLFAVNPFLTKINSGFNLGYGQDGYTRLLTNGGWKWWLCTVGGVILAGPIVTRKELRRCIREHLAGYCNKPEEQPGWRTYARLNKNNFGEHYIWVQSRIPQ